VLLTKIEVLVVRVYAGNWAVLGVSGLAGQGAHQCFIEPISTVEGKKGLADC